MKDNEINVFNYLFEFIGQRKMYFFIYFILLPILPITRNFAVPEITGKIYSNVNNIKKISKLLILLGLCFFIMPFTTCIVNIMAWRVIPVFYEFIVVKIYTYIYNNTYCNYDNIDIGEILLKFHVCVLS